MIFHIPARLRRVWIFSSVSVPVHETIFQFSVIDGGLIKIKYARSGNIFLILIAPNTSSSSSGTLPLLAIL